MNETLAFRRLCYLLRGDLVTGYRSLLMVSATLASIILVAAIVLPGYDFPVPDFHRTAFTIALFAWGIVATSRAFVSLHNKTRNEAYLLLPASSLEKTLARLLAVTVGLVACLLVLGTVVSLVAESLNLALSGNRRSFFDPLDPTVWQRISLYIVLQSLYFLGAVWFRRSHFIKTTLAITLIVAGLVAIGYFTARIVFAGSPLDDVLFMRTLRSIFETEPGSLVAMVDTAFQAVEILLVLACWSIAWLRVAETQVSDGV